MTKHIYGTIRLLGRDFQHPLKLCDLNNKPLKVVQKQKKMKTAHIGLLKLSMVSRAAGKPEPSEPAAHGEHTILPVIRKRTTVTQVTEDNLL